MSRAVLRCSACRYSLLDNFAALAGVSIQHQSRRPFQRRTQPPRPQVRTYTPAPQPPTTPEEPQSDAPQPPPASGSGTFSQASSDSIPWYLQVSTPAPPAPASPLLTLQETPPLPENPPNILEPLLQHLSVRIGLDNLTLIDLRSLHPPPALGANLLMVIGTARSTKHLNVSADRFCRWLRTDWGLRPYADGLLGRNELKLKLRRKARRQKMMGLVGGREVMSDDDGITTGWVCVNVGVVDEDLQPREHVEGAEERAELDPEVEDKEAMKAQERPAEGEDEYTNPSSESFVEEQQRQQTQDQSRVSETEVDEGYIGFGSRSTSPRIVVQMFTEPKRLEMDLEGLWDWRNTRKSSKSERRDAEVEEDLKMRGLVLEDDGEGATVKKMSETWEDDEDDGREVRRKPKLEKGKKIKQQMEHSIFDD